VRRSQLDLEDGVDIADEFELPDPFSSPLARTLDLPDEIPRDTSSENGDDLSRETTPDSDEDQACDRVPSDDDEACGNPFPPPLDRVRPSDFLRARCPLCFGGEFPESRQAKLDHKPDAVVCIDACFTQKHNRQAFHDPPLHHPRSVFLSSECIIATERY
ncbi:hypothetical protein H0H92_001228, partial [Tricholoma furcatifolium]